MEAPAARYAASRRRSPRLQGPLGRFVERYPFALDEFQLQACEALATGRGVLVAAPTGSGKTVVGEFAVELALQTGRKAFYTTPIKALSNQKYADLVRRHGSAAVGLLTGDNSINGEAPVVVMTTEVLRNMVYAGSPALEGLGYVVMDEVHYLADRYRGAVWEEVIIHLPDDVLVASLSATVSNAEEFGAWLDTVRGDTAVVVSEHRPVPLWQHVLVGNRLHDLFADEVGEPVAARDGRSLPASTVRLNPELRQLAREDVRSSRMSRGRGPHAGRGHRPVGRGGSGRTPSRSPSVTPRPDVVRLLDGAHLLPAIVFIFSRAGCEGAVAQCLAAGIRLTMTPERDAIRQLVEARCTDIPEEDLAVLGYWEWAEALERGVASHHAGLLPAFKEVVEDLFSQGLIKVVFATETLALGINMPARSVVLEKLVKWNGDTHAEITPGEYTQLTGRAGRRGIDVEGHAVVLWQPGLDPEAVGGLASTRTYPLKSSFRPTYNMAVNLVSQVGRARAREILETSFAQFQADRAVVGLARQARRQEEALAGYAEAMQCHLGDFAEYAALRRAITEREVELSREASHTRRGHAAESLERLRRGDVVCLPGRRGSTWSVVLDLDLPSAGQPPRLTVLTTDRQVRRLTVADVPPDVTAAGRLTVPRSFAPRNPHSRRDLATALARLVADFPEGGPGRRPRSRAGDDRRLAELRKSLRAHPCHGCDDREAHARWAERWARLSRETAALTRRIESRTNTIARVFDRVCDVLSELGYLDGDRVTQRGQQLRRLYVEADLLVAECLRSGAWDGVDAAGLAACVSAVVYESRREEGFAPRVPPGPIADALQRTVAVWSVLDDRERAHGLTTPTPEPDLGLAWPVARWARGARLESVLQDASLAAGDFVRWCKQVVDLLGQLEQAGGSDEAGRRLAATASEAIRLVRRGVVAYSSVG